MPNINAWDTVYNKLQTPLLKNVEFYFCPFAVHINVVWL